MRSRKAVSQTQTVSPAALVHDDMSDIAQELIVLQAPEKNPCTMGLNNMSQSTRRIVVER